MAWFGKRDPHDVDAVERAINQVGAYVQAGYTLQPVAGRGGLRGRTVTAEVDFSTPTVSAKFLASDFAALCHGRSPVIEPVGDAPPMFFATPESGHPGSLAFDALQGVNAGSAALLKPTGDSMEALLVLDPDELAAIGRWVETIPGTK